MESEELGVGASGGIEDFGGSNQSFNHRCHHFKQTSSLSFVICRLLQKLDLFKLATTVEARSGRRSRLAPFSKILSHLGVLDECCSAAILESEDTQKEEEEEESRGISKDFCFVKVRTAHLSGQCRDV
ncbi:hypothetical protein ACFX14_029379 [Malus domestica]|uniref:Uncharacterized protein n=1 Tax=Malus domestica TaxID=3750 RepID=A0A498KF94_MALDO|nr:hypothetical protein DVH24_038689 [Malus domestica]